MEDGVTEAESLLYPKEEENHKGGDDGRGENHQEGEEDRPSGSLLNSFFFNLVSKGETDEAREEGEGETDEEKGGGILENFISNFVSPLSQKEEETNEDRVGVRDGGTSEGEVGEKEKAKEEVELVTVDEEKESVKTEEKGGGGGGGGIIDQIVSYFPTALPDDAAPKTDEASILLHSIIHD